MKAVERRVCPVCGNEFSGAVEYCPVCMLRGASTGQIEPGESSDAAQERDELTATRVSHRFEHYELRLDQHGKPVELGRGAMGVTYKDSRFVAVSRTLAEYHGRKDPAQMIGLTDRDLFSSEHAEAALADERNIIRTGQPMIDYEEKETWRDREDTWVSTTKMPWRDTQGNIIGTFGITQDITEKKRERKEQEGERTDQPLRPGLQAS